MATKRKLPLPLMDHNPSVESFWRSRPHTMSSEQAFYAVYLWATNTWSWQAFCLKGDPVLSALNPLSKDQTKLFLEVTDDPRWEWGDISKIAEENYARLVQVASPHP